LPYLVGFAFVTFGLRINSVADPITAKNVVTSFDALSKTRMQKKIEYVIEIDVMVSLPGAYLRAELIPLRHRLSSSSLAPFGAPKTTFAATIRTRSVRRERGQRNAR